MANNGLTIRKKEVLTVKKNFLLLFALLAAIILTAGCGSGEKAAVQSAKSDGQNCVACHTSRELILADLKADQLPKAEKSAETSGEG
ncbi:MAG: hypothetical protein WA118_05085 [Carboxydocellales bacterium]